MEQQENNKIIETLPQTNTFTPRRNFGRNSGERRGDRRAPKEQSEYDSAVLHLARVARVTKGGKRFSFRATVAIGNKKGRVGLGVAKGLDVSQSIQKATNRARKNMITVTINKGTILHDVQSKYNSATIILKPAIVGAGVKAGGPVRVIVKLAGIENIIGKILSRSTNKINIARATMSALNEAKAKA